MNTIFHLKRKKKGNFEIDFFVQVHHGSKTFSHSLVYCFDKQDRHWKYFKI